MHNYMVNNNSCTIPVTAIPAMTMPVYVASVPTCLTVSKHNNIAMHVTTKASLKFGTFGT